MNNEIASRLVQLYAARKNEIDTASQLRPDHGRVSKQAIWESIAQALNTEFLLEYSIRQMKKKLQNMYASIKRKIGEEGSLDMTPAKRARLTEGENQLLDLVGPNDFRLAGSTYHEDLLADEMSQQSGDANEHLSTTTNLFLEQLLQQHNENINTDGLNGVTVKVESSPPSSISSGRKRSREEEDDFPEPDIKSTPHPPVNGAPPLGYLNIIPVNQSMSMTNGQPHPEEQNRRHGRRKTHPVWNFFRTEPPNSAICILCNTRIAHGVSTSLCRHVASKHKEYESQIRNGTYNGYSGYRERSSETPEAGMTENDQSGPDFDHIFIALLMRRQDVNILQDSNFQELLSHIPNFVPPTVASLQASIAVKYTNMLSNQTERIMEASSIVLCASVIGKNDAEVIIVLTAHMTNLKDTGIDRFVVDAVVCARSKLATEEIAALFNGFDENHPGMASKIIHYFVKNECSLVADVVKDVGVQRIRSGKHCEGQKIVVTAEDAMHECAASYFWSFFDCFNIYEPMVNLLLKIDVIWESLQENPTASTLFPDLVLPANDSWPSKLAFYEWLHNYLQNQETPTEYLPNFDNAENNLFSHAIEYLKAVRAFFDQMAPESPTISFIVPSILALKQKMCKSQSDPVHAALLKVMAEHFDIHFTPLCVALTKNCPENDKIYLISSFLDRRTSFYLTPEYRKLAAGWLNDEIGLGDTARESDESHDDVENPFSVLESSSGFSTTEMTGMCDELRTYLEEYAKNKVRMNFSSIGFWKEHSKDLPRLASKAVQILAIPTGIEFAGAEQSLGCMSADADVIPIKTAAMIRLNPPHI